MSQSETEAPEQLEPERIEHVLESFTSSSHTWVQRGPFAVCTSCRAEHGTWIGADKRITGVKDGIPVLSVV